MKKYIATVCIILAAAFLWNISYYQLGFFIDLKPNAPVTAFMKTNGKKIYMEKDGRQEAFELRGVNMGAGIPGKWATDFSIDEETYLRWFKQIQELGANSIRIYTILNDVFYNAFYKYNTQQIKNNQEPLYLLQGVWVSDYALFSHMDAYDSDFLKPFIKDCRAMIDVIHGKRTLTLNTGNKGNGSFRKDVSPWVIGYILGVEWEDYTVTYTDEINEDKGDYKGKYMFTTDDATPFEALLAAVGDEIIDYESTRYKQQRLVAFANWPTTDPFVYPASVAVARGKLTCVDMEHIKTTDKFISGMFVSYHVYPYYPDYLEIMRSTGQYSEEEMKKRLSDVRWETVKYRVSKMKGPKIENYIKDENYIDSYGRYNTYLAYLKALTAYHTMPVVISEYGVTTGRGIAQTDKNTKRNQGNMSEKEQGQAIIDCYKDIMDAGCAGSYIFTWQDEWFKRTWNTMHAVDLNKTPYWSDYQTNEQYFGLLSFDPGEKQSICLVDGKTDEWGENDIVISNGDSSLSMKYDEKFVYFLVKNKNFDPEKDTLYIPLDINPKIGSTYAKNYNIGFDCAADFLMVIHGKNDSRLLVQERYECLNAIYGDSYYGELAYISPPEKDSPNFVKIYLPLTLNEYIPEATNTGEFKPTGKKFETGLLRYGNADPDSPDFNSLADFIFADGCAEIKIPWQLLNFSNSSEMTVHDDYYEKYGIENLKIDKINVGVASDGESQYRIPSAPLPLEGWGEKVSYHERLKTSYYMIKDYWSSLNK